MLTDLIFSENECLLYPSITDAESRNSGPNSLVRACPMNFQSERQRCFCVYTFKPLHLEVLVIRLKGISESIIADIKRIKEDPR